MPSLLFCVLGGCLIDRDLYEQRRNELAASPGDGTRVLDGDGDGYAEDDCDDSDASIHPGATEIAYDAIDQDCDGQDLVDVDGDGFDAIVAGGTDCDDEDPGVHPEAEESWSDALHDNDCDGELTTAPAEWLADPILGPAAGAHLGRSVEPWGRADVGEVGMVAGLPLHDTAASGGGTVFLWLDDLTSVHTIRGGSESAYLGGAVSMVSDATGVGTADVLVSATGADRGAGVVYVLGEAALLSNDSTTLPGAEAAILYGAEAGSYFGSALAAVGDVDADGAGDVAVSAPFASAGGHSEAGVVGVWSLPDVMESGSAWLDDATSTIRGGDPRTHLGTSMSMLGDVNGDGYDDVLVTGDVGAVGTVFAGSVSGLSDDAMALQLHGNVELGHEAGRVLAVGDINGDGRTDIAFVDDEYIEFFTALAGSTTGVVGAGHARLLVEPGDFGSYVFDLASVPDADGDGLDEVIVPVAKYGPANYGSAVAVFPGSTLAFGSTVAFEDSPAMLFIQRFDANTGYAAAVGPDLDGDGHRELLLGAPDDSQGGAGAGAIAVIPVPR